MCQERFYETAQLKLEKLEERPLPAPGGCSSERVQNTTPWLMRGDMGPLWGNPAGGTPPGTFIKRWNSVSWGSATIRLDPDMFNLGSWEGRRDWPQLSWQSRENQWEIQGGCLHWKKPLIRSKVHINQSRSSYLCCVFAIFFIISLHYCEKWGKKGIIWIQLYRKKTKGHWNSAN